MFFLYIYICYIHKGVWGAYEAVCLSNWSKYAQSLCIYYRQLTLQLRERELHAAWWLFVFFVIWRRIFLSFICYVGAIYTCSATVNLRKPSCHISASQMSRKARSFLWLWVDVKIDPSKFSYTTLIMSFSLSPGPNFFIASRLFVLFLFWKLFSTSFAVSSPFPHSSRMESLSSALELPLYPFFWVTSFRSATLNGLKGALYWWLPHLYL